MEVKKSPKADLEGKKSTWLLIGYVAVSYTHLLTFFIFFQIHYFQRAFVFPLLLTGKSKMPLAIMSMGILFNLLNGYMQGEWIFYLSPEGMYHSCLLYTSVYDGDIACA